MFYKRKGKREMVNYLKENSDEMWLLVRKCGSQRISKKTLKFLFNSCF